MSAMTYETPRFWERRHSLVTKVTMIVLFWAIAAVVLVTAHRTIEPLSAIACVAAKSCVLILTSLAYIRLTAREATVNHAIFVGIAWLLRAMAVEIALTASRGQGWFDLIGSPDSPYLRDVLLFSWIASPALFVRRSS